MNEAANNLAALPLEDQRLIVASARVVSFTHCAFLLANTAISRFHATSVALKASFSSSLLHVEDNGHFSKKFIDSLRAAFKQRIFANLQCELDNELEASFPPLKHIICLAKSVSVNWPIDAIDSSSKKCRSFSLKFEEGQLTAFEMSSNSSNSGRNSITISGLFWNVPVRLKSFEEAEEWRCLAKMLEDLAVCHFLVHLTLSDQNKLLLDFGPFPCRLDSFLSLKSLLERADFTPIRFTSSKDYALNGYVSLKKLGEAHLHVPKILIINKVPISRSSSLYLTIDKLLSKFYLGGHESRTFSYVISFKMPQQEVSFDWQESSFDAQLKNLTSFRRFLKSSFSSFIKNCREETASSSPLEKVVAPKRRNTFPLGRRSTCEKVGLEVSADEDDPRSTSDEIDQLESRSDPPTDQSKGSSLLPAYFKPPVLPHLSLSDCALRSVDSDFSISRNDLSRLRLVGQFADTVIVCVLDTENTGKILIGIDQHAAHERIRLDRLLNRKPKPITFHGANNVALSLQPSGVFAFDTVKWDRLGFTVTRKDDSALVEAVPDVLLDIFDGDLVSKEKMQVISLASQTVVQILSNSSLYKRLYDVPAVIEAAKSSSCHGAIKAGTKLTHEQCQGILQALAQCHDPFHCAHGRPGVVPIVKLPQKS